MDLSDVVSESNRLGPIAHLATVTPYDEPHVTPVFPGWLNGSLYVATFLSAVKVVNVAQNPKVCLHYQVAGSTDFDSLMLWGLADVLEGKGHRRRLWDGVFDYDLTDFAPDGPDVAPNLGFLHITVTKAAAAHAMGSTGRRTWRSESGDDPAV